jgi:hypothetical protein
MSQNLGIANIGEYTTADSKAKRALGTICIEPVYPTTLASDGRQINFTVNRYMKYTNDAFTEIVGMVTCIDDAEFTSCGSDFSACVGTAAAATFAGCARAVMALNEFGWFQGYGPMSAVAAANGSSITIGQHLTVAASDGECDDVVAIYGTIDAANAHKVQAGHIGWATAAQSSETVDAWIERHPI